MTQSAHTPSAATLPSPKERRRLRQAKAMSLEQLAAELGVRCETLRSWESGRTNPKGRKRAAYAKLLSTISVEKEKQPPAVADTEPPGGDAQERSPQGVEHSLDGVQTHPPARSAPEETPQHGTAPESTAPAPTTPTENEPPPDTPQTAPPEDTAPPTDTTPQDTAPLPDATPPDTAPTPDATPPESAPPPDTTPPDTAPTSDASAPEPTPPAPPARTPAEAFDALYIRAAPALLRQAYLLTGRRRLAQEAVEYAFHLAWQRWPEVATDRDPAGWVRAAAYEYAMAPWHRLRRAHKRPDRPPTDPATRALLDALLRLRPTHRRALLLYDGLGLDLPDTAAETEASTPAAASRLLNARAALIERLPELAEAETPAELSALLQQRLHALDQAVPQIGLVPARAVRTGSERKTSFWTRAALAFTALIVGATAFTVVNAPTRYEPPPSPGRPISGVPVRGGPQILSPEDMELRDKLRAEPMSGPHRLAPEAQ
ncbi:helix-turn-helix domain-containing protein [Streptomyces sp. ISL-98]|uniref:helix-turn-helix domain-containing protein n=1 Tax=Streptomyces sp. ISL-98 TaxID=2819192 RepID=UPI001BE72DB3|nr:helix-turn-helix domain-containing protein [Streptomyces sp. ISL-98]MBT2507168.1 helix-turn-helix domain-containing protein [Streptomyces sp. ISL-98]